MISVRKCKYKIPRGHPIKGQPPLHSFGPIVLFSVTQEKPTIIGRTINATEWNERKFSLI